MMAIIPMAITATYAIVPDSDRLVAGMNPRKKTKAAATIPSPTITPSPSFPPGILNGRGASGFVKRSRTTEMT